MLGVSHAGGQGGAADTMGVMVAGEVQDDVVWRRGAGGWFAARFHREMYTTVMTVSCEPIKHYMCRGLARLQNPSLPGRLLNPGADGKSVTVDNFRMIKE